MDTYDLDTVYGRVVTGTTEYTTLPEGCYVAAYGTGGYLECYQESCAGDGQITACHTEDGACEWVLISQDNACTVHVVRGDLDRIQALVKAEIDHFDSNLIWES